MSFEHLLCAVALAAAPASGVKVAPHPDAVRIGPDEYRFRERRRSGGRQREYVGHPNDGAEGRSYARGTRQDLDAYPAQQGHLSAQLSRRRGCRP